MTDRTHYCAGCKGREDIIRKLEAEVERLTLTVRKLQGHQAALEADNARLRAVVEKYALDLCEMGEQHECCGLLSEVECGGCFARAALQETSHD